MDNLTEFAYNESVARGLGVPDTPLDRAFVALVAAGEALAVARNYESLLEDDRALVKKLAITRVMEVHKLAATAAEKIVELDDEYAAHRQKQRAAVVEMLRAETRYTVAKARATREALLVPAIVDLEAKNAEQAKLITRLKAQAQSSEVACRRSNSMLAERIQDVEQLQKRFNAARETLEAAGLPVPPIPTFNVV